MRPSRGCLGELKMDTGMVGLAVAVSARLIRSGMSSYVAVAERMY